MTRLGLCAAAVLTAATAMPAFAQSTAYSDGRADRTAYERWFASLSRPEQTGATFWASQRSLRTPASCARAKQDDTDRKSMEAGCREAQRRLAPADIRRLSETEYRLGWNAYRESAPVARVARPQTLPAPLLLPTPLTPASTGEMYRNGNQDAQTHYLWWRTLTVTGFEGAMAGDRRAAFAFASSRDCANIGLPLQKCHDQPCLKPAEQHEEEWISACEKEKKWNTNLQRRNKIDPEYKKEYDGKYDNIIAQAKIESGEIAAMSCLRQESRKGVYLNIDNDIHSFDRLAEKCDSHIGIWLQNCLSEHLSTESDCQTSITLGIVGVIYEVNGKAP